jgi:CheY-like chemotaxis protein
MARILIVEDSQMMQAYYKQIIGALPGYHLIFARNGLEALDRIAHQGQPDLVLLDINMPVMDGLEFLERYRQDQPSPPSPVVLVTTEGREDDFQRGREAGAAAYITKPFKPGALYEVIRSLLGGVEAVGGLP